MMKRIHVGCPGSPLACSPWRFTRKAQTNRAGCRCIRFGRYPIASRAHGSTPRTRSFTLTAQLYGTARADKAAYTRQAGLSAMQHEQLVLNFVSQHGRIRRADVMELCRLNEEQAKILLQKLKQAGLLQLQGTRGGAYYTVNRSA